MNDLWVPIQFIYLVHQRPRYLWSSLMKVNLCNKAIFLRSLRMFFFLTQFYTPPFSFLSVCFQLTFPVFLLFHVKKSYPFVTDHLNGSVSANPPLMTLVKNGHSLPETPIKLWK